MIFHTNISDFLSRIMLIIRTSGQSPRAMTHRGYYTGASRPQMGM